MTPHEGLRLEYPEPPASREPLPQNPAPRVCILAHGGFA
jgi:hypothetical protein